MSTVIRTKREAEYVLSIIYFKDLAERGQGKDAPVTGEVLSQIIVDQQ